MATYAIEFAKSGRSACKKCKEKIAKDALRVQSTSPGGDYDITQNFHAACFSVPKKLKMTAEQFVEDILEDSTGGEILPSMKEEIVEGILNSAKNVKARKSEDGATWVETKIGPLKALWEELHPEATKKGKKRKKDEEAEEEGEKKEGEKKKPKLSQETQKQVEIYGKHCGKKLDELRDILRWNRQVVAGTNMQLLWKVMDGESRGRLANCQLDGGRLKMDLDHPDQILCLGRFDEDSSIRKSCFAKHSVEDAPRWKWYTEEPTEEEKKLMDQQEAEARGEEAEPAEIGDGSAIGQLMEKAKGLGWDLSSGDGKKAAAKALIELLGGEGLDMPTDEKKCFREVGALISTDLSMSAADAVKIVTDKYGFAEVKADKAAKKEKAIEKTCAVPANGPLLAVFDELSGLYFKDGNSNAGVTYKKIVKIVGDLDFEITAENAMSLSKGKTKIDGIGKASALKMKEFLETGKLEKLEEKRASMA